MPIITTSIPEATAAQLHKLARDTGRSVSSLVAQALEEYLAKNAWETARIRQSLEQVRRGEVASHEEVRAAFAAWGFSIDSGS